MEHNKRLHGALRTLFYPLAKLFLKNKVGVSPVVHQLKLAFVEAARNNCGRNGKPASANRIANLTGMSRKHVGELLSEVEHNPSRHTIAGSDESHILAVWCADEEFRNELGLPRPLELGPGPGSLHALITESVDCPDVDLFVERLLTGGNIRQRDDGRFELTSRVFRINRDWPRIISSI